MIFLRKALLGLREVARIVKVSFSALSDWNRGFDENMTPLNLPDNRGKGGKITLEMVKVIVRAAEDLKSQGKRLRIKGFTQRLRKDHDIYLSRRKVQEVLVANGLFAVSTRRKRPRFYQSLRKEIPNGLVSLDGSELTVWLGGEPCKFSVELSVDVKTFTHTGFSVGDAENSEEVIKVLEAHRKDWAPPWGCSAIAAAPISVKRAKNTSANTALNWCGQVPQIPREMERMKALSVS